MVNCCVWVEVSMLGPRSGLQGTLCIQKYRGGGVFTMGEFCRENFAVKKGEEIFPWQNFGGTVPYFATAAGIVSSESFGDFNGGEIICGEIVLRQTPPPLYRCFYALPPLFSTGQMATDADVWRRAAMSFT